MRGCEVMPHTTPFDTSRHHIFTTFIVTHPTTGTKHSFEGIIDTGAPHTEFTDTVLARIGIIKAPNPDIQVREGLQSQKYGRITFPQLEICGQVLKNFQAFVTKLDESFGVDALIGLDFFRKFEVKINYKLGTIVTEGLKDK